MFNSGQNAASYIGMISGIYTPVRPMTNFLLSVRQIFQFQFWPHRRYCHVILGQLLRKYDVIDFQDGGRRRSILLPVLYFLMSLPSEGQNLLTNQILSTSMVNIISIYGWDITISGLEKQMSTILEIYFRFRSRPIFRNLYFISVSACRILSKSELPLRKYNVISLYQDGGRNGWILLPVSYQLMSLHSEG